MIDKDPIVGRLVHIGIAVKELEPVGRLYRETLRLAVSEVDENEELRWQFVPLGETSLEFIESKVKGTAISRFIEKRGEGIHHIAVEVDDIHEALRSIKESGIPLIDERPRKGAHNSLIAFIHPKATQGVLIEMVQTDRSSEQD